MIACVYVSLLVRRYINIVSVDEAMDEVKPNLGQKHHIESDTILNIHGDSKTKSSAFNESFDMSDEDAYGTGSFTVDEHQEMLYKTVTRNLNNAPPPCTDRGPNSENSMTVRLTNDFIHTPSTTVTPRNVIGHCKLYGLLILVILSVALNVVLVTITIWYARMNLQPPGDHTPLPTVEIPKKDYSRYIPLPAGKVDNLIAVPCNARANLVERFPNVLTEYVNVSVMFPENPVQQFCYLPKSEPLNHFLRIVNLVKHAVNGSLGIQRKHCVSLKFSPPNGVYEISKYRWEEQGPIDDDNIFKVLHSKRTNQLQLNGPSGYYLVMANTVYRSSEAINTHPVTLQMLVNGQRVMSQTKTLFSTDAGYLSLSFHDVVQINKHDEIKFNMTHANQLYNVKNGVHTAYMCCIPALQGCIT